MESQTHAPVRIQTSSRSVPATPSWLGEVAVIAQYLQHVGVLATIAERVRFARRRFGYYDVIDFVVVLLGYAISGERTLEAFYECVQPFATPFMALFERDLLPARSMLSRFLAALDQTPVEALRVVFLEDLLARPLEKEEKKEGCGIGKESIGTCLMSMARDKPPANELSPARLISHRPSAGWTRSVLQATRGASGVKPFAPGPPCSRPIPINGSARFRGHREQATAITEESCGRQ